MLGDVTVPEVVAAWALGLASTALLGVIAWQVQQLRVLAAGDTRHEALLAAAEQRAQATARELERVAATVDRAVARVEELGRLVEQLQARAGDHERRLAALEAIRLEGWERRGGTITPP